MPYADIWGNIFTAQQDIIANGREDQKISYLKSLISSSNERTFSHIAGLYLMRESGMIANISRLQSVRNLHDIRSYKLFMEQLHPGTDFSHQSALTLWRLREIMHDTNKQIFSSHQDSYALFPIVLMALAELGALGVDRFSEIGASPVGDTDSIDEITYRLYTEYANEFGYEKTKNLTQFVASQLPKEISPIFLQKDEQIMEDTKKLLENILEKPITNHTIDIPILSRIQKQS